MTDNNAVARLLSWCSERGFWLDPRIRVDVGPSGVSVISRNSMIPVDSILVRIPRQSVLSVKSSPISELIPPNPFGRGAQLSLALAVSVELVCGVASSWFPYLQSLPREIPGMPIFWTGGANGAPAEWLNGTEAWKILFESAENRASLFNEIDTYYHQVATPVYSEACPHSIPSLRNFYYAYALVSSRSFLVDSYHGLAMVPIADAFNHAQDNHVHLESDFDVCPECGSLQQCAHDDNEAQDKSSPVAADDYYEMVSIRPIPKNSEVFNTYGETLSNAELLVQYGFILDVNDNDRIVWTFDQLAQFAENYQLPARNWDALGGLESFRKLVSGLIPQSYTALSQSELVHVDHTRDFCINGDASVSHGLWLYFVLLLLQLRNSPVESVDEAMNCQLELEQDAFSGVDVHVQPPLPNDHPPAPGPQHHQQQQISSPYGVIPELAHLLVALCRARFSRIGIPGVETTTEELGEMLDRLPDDDTLSRSTRMAISLAMTERSLLDSCMAAWEGMLRA